MRRLLPIVLVILVVITAGCEVKILFSDEYGFEDDRGRWEVWVDPAVSGYQNPWRLERDTRYARSGDYALKASFYKSLSERPYALWIEKPLEAFSYAQVQVVIKFALYTEDQSMFWDARAYVGTRAPANIQEFQRLDHPEGSRSWRAYEYETILELDQYGVIWVAVGLNPEYHDDFTFYIDDISVEVKNIQI